MGITRLSPGVYSNGSRKVNARDMASAQRMFNGGGSTPQTQAQPQAAGAPATPAAPAQPTYDLSTPQGAFQAQIQSNNQTAAQQSQWNRVNEVGPYGSATYSMGPNGTVTRNYSLNSGQQQIDDQRTQQDINLGHTANKLVNDAYGSLTQQYDLSGAPSLLSDQDAIAERKRIEGTIYDRFKSRMQPEFDTQMSQLEQRLAERGIPVGSEAYNTAMQKLRQSQSDASLDAQARAAELGGNELTRNYGISADKRSRYIDEYDRSRRASLADLGGIYGLQRGVQQQPFSGISQVSVPSASLADLGIQYQQLANQRLAAQRSGGGGSKTDPFALARFNAELAEQSAQNNFDRELQLIAAQAGDGGADFSDIAIALGGGLIGSAGSAWANSYFGG